MNRPELVIVGIDPGTTSAVAIQNLEGELIDYSSRKNFSKDRVIEFIVENGKPLLVASDVSPAPDLVEEIASNTGSVLVEPERDLKSDYKDSLVSDLPVRGEDSHVRDALASSEYARREYSDKLREIERRVENEGAEEDLGDIIELVIRGSMSISDAISEVQKVEEVGGEEEAEEEQDWRDLARKRKDRIDILESKVENLEEHLEDIGSGDSEPERVQNEIRDKDRTIRELRDELRRSKAERERLESENEALKEAVEKLDRGWLRVPKLRGVGEADQETVFLESYEGEEIPEEVQRVVMEEECDELKEKGIEVLDLDSIERMVETDDSYVIHREGLETAEEPEGFMEWLEGYRER